MEAVLSARPDVVVGSPAVLKGRLADVLQPAGARLVPVWFETASDVEPGIRAIGEAVGRAAERFHLLSVLQPAEPVARA